MKNIACLLVVLLATQTVLSAAVCPTTVVESNFFVLMKTGTSALVDADFQLAAGTATTSATECGGSSATFCLTTDVTKSQAWLNARLANVKTALTSFGSVASKVGTYITKINSIANATDFATVFPTTLAADQLSGATGAQAQAFIKTFATPADYTTAYTNFNGQVIGCFDFIKASYQKIMCSAIQETSSKLSPWVADGGVIINAAGCSALVAACGKVWNFFHKVQWTVSAAAYYNKKKDTTKTYTFPATVAAVYFDSAATLDSLNTAFTNCAADSSVATCLAADKSNICKAFFKPFADMPLAANAITFIDTNNPVSAVTRRMLLVANTGVITIAETGHVDITSTNVKILSLPAASPTAFVAADIATWSSGYVAAGSGSGNTTNTTNTTTKNAKVVIGTILSALFAIALLN